ncbi:MAG: hypothetical protein LBP70_01440 [Mycoplasmataceae bacterium]|jgi:hypothetical protein|nr:hypothetical protein [Mycoplasmataceae bacterium]
MVLNNNRKDNWAVVTVNLPAATRERFLKYTQQNNIEYYDCIRSFIDEIINPEHAKKYKKVLKNALPTKKIRNVYLHIYVNKSTKTLLNEICAKHHVTKSKLVAEYVKYFVRTYKRNMRHE